MKKKIKQLDLEREELGMPKANKDIKISIPGFDEMWEDIVKQQKELTSPFSKIMVIINDTHKKHPYLSFAKILKHLNIKKIKEGDSDKRALEIINDNKLV